MADDKHLSVLSGSFLSAEAPVPLDALSPNPGNDFADLQSLLVNASGEFHPCNACSSHACASSLASTFAAEMRLS